ncbi:MAG: hypothetical protein FJW38_31095 [Acidobacteria bacterium]|nr:hypothetical protein [Acidobacteriota bacterium]
MSDLRQLIPGYGDAVESERMARVASFLRAPDAIGGIAIEPLSVRHILILELAGNAFVCGGHLLPADVVQFLWVCSPHFKPGDNAARDALVKRAGLLPFDDTAKSILARISAAFADMPATREHNGTTESYWHWAASLVDVLASQYGWSEQSILDLPMSRAFQYLRIIRKRTEPDLPLFNPMSDKVKSDWLAEQNRKDASVGRN